MRTLRKMLNPVSTAATEWWCHSALRRRLVLLRQLAGAPPEAWTKEILASGQIVRSLHARPLLSVEVPRDEGFSRAASGDAALCLRK